ncbi:Transcriptional regulator [Candidatus Paraburkholderia kirkii]|nr:Transcriptional regulator [Candidatus Paraburkholderia kirkii]
MEQRNPPIELRLLRYFVTVAEEMHFGRAAARLAMTQPPLSQAIRALKDALGVALFVRTKRTVELTPVGKDLLPEVRRLLASADALRPLAQSLAFVSTADYGLLPALLRDFGARHPGVRLQLTEATSDVQIEELVARRIDAGLVIPPLPPRYASALSYVAVAREPLVIAMSANAALELGLGAQEWAETPVDLHDLAAAPLVVFPRRLAPGLYDIVMGCYGVAGLTPGQEAIQMQTIVSLVSTGMGVALVPRSLRHLRRTGVVYRPLRPLDESATLVETGLVWRAAEVSPVLAGFIEIVRTRAAAVGAL